MPKKLHARSIAHVTRKPTGNYLLPATALIIFITVNALMNTNHVNYTPIIQLEPYTLNKARYHTRLGQLIPQIRTIKG